MRALLFLFALALCVCIVGAGVALDHASTRVFSEVNHLAGGAR